MVGFFTFGAKKNVFQSIKVYSVDNSVFYCYSCYIETNNVCMKTIKTKLVNSMSLPEGIFNFEVRLKMVV